jgi:hypothetical protein
MDADATATPAPRRDQDSWARPVDALRVDPGTDEHGRRGVDGRRVAGPVQGFGRMWQKTYRIHVGDRLTPEEVIAHWKGHFGEFWPENNRFTAPLAGVQPGEVGLISASMGGLRLSTGVLVLYADDVSFAYLTPEGHPFAGLITFSAHRDGAATAAQIQLLIRAQDPMTEVGMAFGGHRKENRMWEHTLRSLAASLGIDGEPSSEIVCVDRRRQWRRFGNVRHDPVLRAVAHPFSGRRGSKKA